ncbi:peptidase M56 [Flavobacterium zepuense]|uniref:Peptidase M56 n=1 Tax=Flavobacterium zepuense TaxID=2593302 RepID=A0A552VAS0_9FLAO|nr:M56 family metallopeptidase [Flavobacterium zepuense]TRW27572.1 peptidase M56 [Flavobacterium zepuense]
MEAAIIYLIKVSAIIMLFMLAYQLFLKKETFFTTNRLFLLAGLGTAVLLPLIAYTKIVWVSPAPVVQQQQTINVNALIASQNAFAKLPVQQSFTINWWYVALGIYTAGVVVLSIIFIKDIIRLRLMLKGQKVVKQDGYRFIDSATAKAPFSFFRYIVYNSSMLQPQELESIIAHEKVHSGQRHSLDMIISELFCIILWFNPFVWWYKKAIAQNLEFIADAEAIKLLTDKTAYQKTLVKITIQPECIAITNHFYQSLIKKRIVMLNKAQSKKRNGLKYMAIMPMLAAFMFLFQYKVVAQVKESSQVNVSADPEFSIDINKNSTDADLAKAKKTFKDKYNVDVTFSNVKRNSKGEMTSIKTVVKENGRSMSNEIESTTPIKPFQIVMDELDGSKNAMIVVGKVRIAAGYPPAPPMPPNATSPVPLVPPVPPVPAKGHSMIINSGAQQSPALNFGDDALVIINGVKQPKGSVVTLPAGHQVVGVATLDKKEAKDKYGKEGKKGAVEITTAANGYAFMMPDEATVMGYAQMGLDEGFKALSNINFDEIMSNAFAHIDIEAMDEFSEEQRSEIGEDLKRAEIELRRVGPELQRSFEAHRMSKEDMEDAKREIEAAKKEIQAAKKEIEAAKKEMERARQERSRKA